MIPYLYPLGNWYATYFELALSTKLYVFSCLDLDLWIANFKICLILCLGGLGPCGRTVSLDYSKLQNNVFPFCK